MSGKKLPSGGLAAVIGARAVPRAKALRESLPAAVGEKRGGGEGVPLQLVLPPAVVRELKIRAATDQTTVRAIVLRALSREGFKVDPAELTDRRRAK
jgi:hypothetical protein